MKQLVTDIVKTLVDKEDLIVVKEVAGDSTTIIEVSADPTDLGKIIGKQGNTAKAIRTLLKAASKKYNKKFMLNIV